MRYQQDRHAAAAGKVAQQMHDFLARNAVERRRRLVGQDQAWVAGQGAGHGDTLALATGQLGRQCIGARPQADGVQQGAGAAKPFGFGGGGVQLQRHRHVLPRGQEAEQVVLLEDEADATAQQHALVLGGAQHLLAQHLAVAFLHGPQRADQRQQRGLAAARRAGQQDDLAGADLQRDVAQHRTAQLALAIGIAQAFDRDRCRAGHQNMSAGSASLSLRTASRPAAAHMAKIMPKTIRPRFRSISSGRKVAWATTR